MTSLRSGDEDDTVDLLTLAALDPVPNAKRRRRHRPLPVLPPVVDAVPDIMSEAVRREKALVESKGLSSITWDLRDDDSVRSLVLRHGAAHNRCYCGITVSPAWRWTGGPTETSYVIGHRATYDRMLVVAARLGNAGPTLERELITLLKAAARDVVDNLKGGGGGIAPEADIVYFLYVCT